MRTRLFQAQVAACSFFILSASCGNELGTTEQPTDIQVVQSEFGSANVSLVLSQFPSPSGAGWSGWNPYLSQMLGWGKQASAIAGYVSSFVGGVNAAIMILNFLGILNPGPTELQQLTANLNAIGTGITWQVTQSFIDTHNGPILGVLNSVHDNPAFVTAGSTADMNAMNGVIGLEANSAWQRAQIGSSNDVATDGDRLTYPIGGCLGLAIGCLGGPFQPIRNYIQTWKHVVPARNNGGSFMNQVFDWRLGAPFLLKGIAARLVILGHVDPDFRTNHHNDAELTMMRNALESRYNTMVDGVQCAQSQFLWGSYLTSQSQRQDVYGCNIVCADIYSGISALSSITPKAHTKTFGGPETGAQCNNVAGTTEYIAIWNATAEAVRKRMPLYDMRWMIDTLHTYIKPQPGLGQASFRIKNTGGMVNCLDTVGGSMDNGTRLVMSPCGSVFPLSQWWIHDRQTGQIRNPFFNKCVDEHWSVTTGTGIGIWDCDTPTGSPPDIASLPQKWSYDPTRGFLQNWHGVTMRAINPWVSGSQVVTEYLTIPSFFGLSRISGGFYPEARSRPVEDRAWHADVPTSTSCGTLLAGQGINGGSNLPSCDGRFSLVLQTDGNLALFQIFSGGAAQIWSNNKQNSRATKVLLGADGNLVASRFDTTIWSTDMAGSRPSSRLVVQNDGDVVIYDAGNVAQWRTGTCCR